jgi:hypothetical protein
MDSSVGIATGYGVNGRDSTPVKGKIFSGAHPAYYPTDTMGSLYGAKRKRHGANHSPPYSAKVNNSGAIPPFHGVVKVKLSLCLTN